MRHPKLFAGVLVHSGVACGAASAPLTAMHVLKHGADTDYETICSGARKDAPRRALPVPLLAIAGADDDAVAEINTVQLVRQYLVFNGKLLPHSAPPNALPPADHEVTTPLGAGRSMSVSDYVEGARLVARRVRVTGLAHAWSGGDGAFPYNDPGPPDAMALLAEFIAAQS
jgi:hypothetical protein